MTTKKHFIAFAQFAATIPDKKIRMDTTDHFCTIFRAENPRFDARRFRAYVENHATTKEAEDTTTPLFP